MKKKLSKRKIPGRLASRVLSRWELVDHFLTILQNQRHTITIFGRSKNNTIPRATL